MTKAKTVMIINAYEGLTHGGHYEIVPFTSKRKACQRARKLAKSNFLGWGATGYITVMKNGEVALSLPIHKTVERKRGMRG